MERIISIIGIIAIIGLLFYNKDKSWKDMLLKCFKVSIITYLVLLVIPLVFIIYIVVEGGYHLCRLSQMGVWDLIEMFFISVPFKICHLVIICLEKNTLIQIIVFGLCLGILFIVRKKKLIKSGINKS